MGHTKVLSYDYSNRNKRRRQTNAPPTWAISMAMAVRRCDMKCITLCGMTRASPEATGRRHRATTRSVLPHQPPGRQSTQRWCNMYSLCWPFQWPLRCGGTIARIDRLRRFVAFNRATKRHHRTSTCSDIIKGTRQLRLFWTYHREKELQLTCWPLIKQ